MNLLFGKVRWNEDTHLEAMQDNVFNSGFLDLYVERDSVFKHDSRPYFYDDNTGVLSAVLGYISNIEEIKARYSLSNETDVEVVERLYALEGIKFVSQLDGIFLILIFHEATKRAYILQSRYGYNLPIYYTGNDNEFTFGTSLKQVLKHNTATRELNIAAARDFLHYSSIVHQAAIVPNRATLVSNISKLVTHEYMIIDGMKGSNKVKSLKFKEKEVAKELAKDELIATVDNSVRTLVNQLRTDNITATLTSGRDSNLILHFLRRLTDNTIKIVTLSGGEGHNEIPATQAILRNYDNIEHITDTLHSGPDKLPDIVWKLEGYTFQEGVFLRYQLSEILSRENLRFAFLGACADQMLDRKRRSLVLYESWIRKMVTTRVRRTNYIVTPYRFIRNILRTTYLNVKGSQNHKGPEFPEPELRATIRPSSSNVLYDIEADYLSKMHGMLLNSFGVQGIYAYVNKDIVGMSKALGMLNRRKGFFNQRVQETLAPEITTNFALKGPTTSLKDLVPIDENMLTKLLQLELVNRILSKSQIERIANSPGDYHLLILQLIYLYLFNQLFISGEFDSFFDEPHTDKNLGDFFPQA